MDIMCLLSVFFFLLGNLTREIYLQLLVKIVHLALPEIFEQNKSYNANEWIFQQNRAPRHYSLTVRQYSNEIFFSRRIG